MDKNLAKTALEKLEVDAIGLDGNDLRYLNFIAEFYNGGPVGVETICAGLSEQRDTIEETIEPYLLQQGLIQRTARGRMMTKIAFDHLLITPSIDFFSEKSKFENEENQENS